MGERRTFTRQANDAAAGMTVAELAQVVAAWQVMGVPAGTVPVARVDRSVLWSLSVTVEQDETEEGAHGG